MTNVKNTAAARRLQATFRADIIAALGMPEEGSTHEERYALATGELLADLRVYDADEAQRVEEDYVDRLAALERRMVLKRARR